MFHLRRTSLAALTLWGVAGLAMAQTPPSSDQQMSPPPASSSGMQNQNSGMQTGNSSANDPKLNDCISKEKAKNTGQSDNQVKQKCMLQIASHQGKGQ
jgi:Flp pilus assembly protein TadD